MTQFGQSVPDPQAPHGPERRRLDVGIRADTSSLEDRRPAWLWLRQMHERPSGGFKAEVTGGVKGE